MIKKYKDGASIQQIGRAAILRSKYGKFTNERRLLNNIVHSADIDVRSNNKYKDITHNYDEIVEVFLKRLSKYSKKTKLPKLEYKLKQLSSKSPRSSKKPTSPKLKALSSKSSRSSKKTTSPKLKHSSPRSSKKVRTSKTRKIYI